MIDEKKLIEILEDWKFKNEEKGYDTAKDLVQEMIYIVKEQPQCICTRREWYQKGYQDGLNADKWISVEERLPSEHDEYLVWWNDVTRNEYYEIAEYSPKEGWIGNIQQAFDGKYTVIAWQPLPQPYKKGVK